MLAFNVLRAWLFIEKRIKRSRITPGFGSMSPVLCYFNSRSCWSKVCNRENRTNVSATDAAVSLTCPHQPHLRPWPGSCLARWTCLQLSPWHALGDGPPTNAASCFQSCLWPRAVDGSQTWAVGLSLGLAHLLNGPWTWLSTLPFLGLPVGSAVRTFDPPVLFAYSGTAPGVVKTLPVLYSPLTPGSFPLWSSCSLAVHFFFALGSFSHQEERSFSWAAVLVTQQNFFVFAFSLKLQRDYFWLFRSFRLDLWR